MVIEQYCQKHEQFQTNLFNVIYLPKVHESVIEFPTALFLFTFKVILSNIQNGVSFGCECWVVSWCQFIKIKTIFFLVIKAIYFVATLWRKICGTMATIWKAPFEICTANEKISGYFGLNIIMTCKVFTDIKY